jgi:hypothetical protein
VLAIVLPLVLAIVLPLVLATVLATGAAAQTPATRFQTVMDASIGAPADHELVRTMQRKAAELFAAGALDFGGEDFMNRSFFCPATLAALPLRARLYKRADDARFESPLLHFDSGKSIAWGDVFEAMNPEPVAGLAKAWEVRGMFIHQVARPDQGFRLNFGRGFGKDFGDDPAKDPLFKAYSDVDATPLLPRLAARIRQAPIHVMFDVGGPLTSGLDREFKALFGPRALLLGGSVSRLGKQLVLDAFCGCGAGDGLVGNYLAPRAGAARILGAMHRTPGGIFTADLGKHFSRAAMTALRALQPGDDLRAAKRTLDEFLEVWTGEVTVVFDGRDPGPEVDFERQMETLARSLHGSITLGIEDDAGSEIEAGLESALRGPAGKLLGLDAKAIGEGPQLTFAILGGRKHLAVGSTARLLTISIADRPERCLADLRQTLQSRSTVPTPGKFGMAQGPVKLWLRAGLVRYVHAWGRYAGELVGREATNITAWAQQTLEQDLLPEDVALTLSWDKRTGSSLRVVF